MRLNAKELIAEARVTAPTLPPAAAKLITAMADRLDLQFVVLCESRNEAKQLAGENALMKSAIKTHSESVHFCVGCGKDDPCSNDDVCYALEETPATDALLASLRAEARKQGAVFAANRMLAAWDAGFIDDTPENAADIARAILMSTEFMDEAPDGDFDRSFADEVLEAIAAQLRSRSVSSAGVDQPPVSPAIKPLPVERNQYGYWTHPVYEEFCDGREYISNEEFNVWMKANGLEWKVDYRDEEDIDPEVDGYDLSTWQPEAPAGEGWFVGSIHDTDDGAVCLWLRYKC